MLTYAAVPDPLPAASAAVVDPGPLHSSGDWLRPSPTFVPLAAVVRHACRHLAFLRRSDPRLGADSFGEPAVWGLIDAFAPAVSGQLSATGVVA
ncbi:hypothetical protein Afe04nite_20090 [Asanoa ferruginea]|nr:hypothetical protein Afe04nite_20090 [Asanoa ferruginea]